MAGPTTANITRCLDSRALAELMGTLTSSELSSLRVKLHLPCVNALVLGETFAWPLVSLQLFTLSTPAIQAANTHTGMTLLLKRAGEDHIQPLQVKFWMPAQGKCQAAPLDQVSPCRMSVCTGRVAGTLPSTKDGYRADFLPLVSNQM